MSTYFPTLKQLQYLVSLQEHGHFGKAAEACFVTQSTLSAGIRELESLLGLMLVERKHAALCALRRLVTKWLQRRTAYCVKQKS